MVARKPKPKPTGSGAPPKPKPRRGSKAPSTTQGQRAAGARYAAQAPPSVPAKNTGGLPKKTAADVASWGGWSVPKIVREPKRSAGQRSRRLNQGR